MLPLVINSLSFESNGTATAPCGKRKDSAIYPSMSREKDHVMHLNLRKTI